MSKYWEQIKDIKENGDEKRDFDIAAILFAFDNQKLFSLLKKRGEYLSTANYAKSFEIEDDLMELIQHKEYMDKTKRPVTAFVTFNN